MIVYYNQSTGHIYTAIEANSPSVKVPNNQGTPLYLDDTQYPALYNSGEPLINQYIIENSVPIKDPNWPPTPTLAQANTTQSTAIEVSYTKAMGAGFTSSADGTSRIYAVTAQGIVDVGLAKTITQAEYPTAGIEAELLDGSFVALDYSQMQTFATDLQNFYLPLRSKRIQLLNKIKVATTVSDVQAVTW